MPPRSLPGEEVQRLRAALLSKLGLPANAAPPLVLDRIMERSVSGSIDAFDAADLNFASTLASAGIAPRPTLYYWHAWDKIDIDSREELSANMRHRWKSATPDDVDIFDDSLTWMFSIFHDRWVGLIKF